MDPNITQHASIMRDDRACQEFLLREGVGLLSGLDPEPGHVVTRSVRFVTATNYVQAFRFVGHANPLENGYMLVLLPRSADPKAVALVWNRNDRSFGVEPTPVVPIENQLQLN